VARQDTGTAGAAESESASDTRDICSKGLNTVAWEGKPIRLTDRERQYVRSRIDRRGPEECWPWVGFICPLGYGVYKGMRSNRLTWTLERGDIPPFRVVMHTCDDRRCCNPNHLRLGSQGENMTDCCRKGRIAPSEGELNSCHRLTLPQVREIRERYATGNATYKELAQEYRCAASNIGSIVRGRTWSFDLEGCRTHKAAGRED
jgi:hypothetical protein